MKKVINSISIACFIAAVFATTSCSKSQEELIVGTWKATSVTSTPENPLAVFFKGMTYTFNANNTCSVHVSVMGVDSTANGAYTIADGQLTLTMKGGDGESDSSVMGIRTLDKKNLVLLVEDGSMDMVEIVDSEGNRIHTEVTINCERQ